MNADLLDRGMTGVLPRVASLADESYLDFIESVRTTLLARIFPVASEAGHKRMAERGLPLDDHDLPLGDISDAFGEVPGIRSWQRFMRTQQEMMWRRTRGSFGAREAGHVAALQAAENAGPGRLTYDKDFVTPDYARREIHLQPGGYTDDPLGGLTFHYGTKVFYEGGNDQDELHAEIAGAMAVPADGKVARVLDVGCSIGQATVQLKKRFPDAEVTGLDVALPMLRYAHMRSAGQGVDVSYVQALAEDTGLPDAQFDAIMAYILFHELPIAVIPKVLGEIHRMLRPGGVFTVFEFPNLSRHAPPAFRFLIDVDSRDNCEPYSRDFVACDFPALLAEAGFAVAQGAKTSNAFLNVLVATKPA